MALYSFRHSVKTFSPKCESDKRVAAIGQTASHIRYITREYAARTILRTRIEGSSDQKQALKFETEAQARKGRVCERFIIALPVEASAEQRIMLATRFAEELTQGIAGYILAIHDKHRNDTNNPHFHIIAFDKHISSGGRGRPRSLIGMARKHAVEHWGQRWAAIHNEMMSDWGFGTESQISNESYASRGIDRIPEIHEGPAARKIARAGKELSSNPEWRHVDGGHTRAEANSIIRQINISKEEIKNAESIRLGGADNRNTFDGERSNPPFGTSSKRCGDDPIFDKRPGGFVEEIKQRSSNDQVSPFQHRDKAGPPESVARKLPNAKLDDTSDKTTPPFNGVQRNSAHHRWIAPVRRIFIELVILRDRLQAGLASAYTNRVHPTQGMATELPRSVSRNGLKRSTKGSQLERD